MKITKYKNNDVSVPEMTEKFSPTDVRKEHVETVRVLVTPQQGDNEGMGHFPDNRFPIKSFIYTKTFKYLPENVPFIDHMFHLLQFYHLRHCQDFQCMVVFCPFVLKDIFI